MSDLLALVRDFFVAPPEAAPQPRAVPVPAPAVAVLGRPVEAVTAAPALALVLAGRGLQSCAVVCEWRTGGPRPRLPATGSARRLAWRLEARGLAAEASGRLVRVRLPADSPAAAAAAERAAGASCPVVLALAGARDEWLDHLLAMQDLVVLARSPASDPALARAAEASLAGLPVPVVGCQVTAQGPLRAAAVTGLLVPPRLKQALLPALEAVK